MNPLIYSNTLDIKASPATVWEVLTAPAFTKQYMFGCEASTDWKVGSPLLWKGHHQGQEKIFVKGAVLKIEPAKLLVYTTFDPNKKLDDKPANYLTVTYTLTAKPDGTSLGVSQGDFANVVNGEARYSETVGGWNAVLPTIKDIAEKAEAEALNKASNVPHTDYDAAAAIGRKTGGEVFDD